MSEARIDRIEGRNRQLYKNYGDCNTPSSVIDEPDWPANKKTEDLNSTGDLAARGRTLPSDSGTSFFPSVHRAFSSTG